MLMPGLQSLKASDNIAENIMLNSIGTTLFDSIGHWECFGGCTVIQDSGHHTVIELADYCNERAWAAKFFHNPPESVPTHCVEEFLQAPFLLTPSSMPGSAWGGNIHRFDVETRCNIVVPIAVTLFRPIAISYDPRDQTIYWTEVGEVRGIRSSALNGSGVRTFLDSGANSVLDGLAVDPLSRQVFYTDAGRSQIGMVTIATRAHRTIVNTSLDKPRAIVLDTANGVMFWTDWGRERKIERVNYDGSDRKTIVNTALFLPNGLALDVAKNRLYWVDAGTNKVEMSDLLGNGRRSLLSLEISSSHHFFGLARLDSTLYFTDWLTGAATNVSVIYGMTIGESNVSTQGLTRGRRLNDILVVQPKLYNDNSTSVPMS
ncbi:hypothetical protein ACOMHN_006538 [Nucella lapillus]